jgi:hypothetical protein
VIRVAGLLPVELPARRRVAERERKRVPEEAGLRGPEERRRGVPRPEHQQLEGPRAARARAALPPAVNRARERERAAPAQEALTVLHGRARSWQPMTTATAGERRSRTSSRRARAGCGPVASISPVRLKVSFKRLAHVRGSQPRSATASQRGSKTACDFRTVRLSGACAKRQRARGKGTLEPSPAA